jgi:hypothetical protein
MSASEEQIHLKEGGKLASICIAVNLELPANRWAAQAEKPEVRPICSASGDWDCIDEPIA